MNLAPQTDPTFDEQLLLEMGKLNHATSVGLGEQVLKASFILNGGGLIALPAILKLFEPSISIASVFSYVCIAITLFVAGLVFAWLSAALGFLANRQVAEGFLMSFQLSRMKRNGNQVDPKKEARAQKYLKVGRRNAFCMKIVSVASLLTFIFGSLLSAYAILAHIK